MGAQMTNDKKAKRELRLKKLLEREIAPQDLDQVGGGRKEHSRGDSRYCAF
jgi:hypothetical protein